MINKKLTQCASMCMLILLTPLVWSAEKFTIDNDFAHHFAEDWIDSWNQHDLKRILSHYTEDFEMTSPNIVIRGLDASGTLKGKPAIANYWSQALQPDSKLQMTLLDTLVAIDSLTIYYHLRTGRTVAEVFHFNSEGLVYKSFAHYAPVKSQQ